MNKSKFIIIFLLFCTPIVFAQNVSINETGATANSSAMLDVSSSTKGILIPRLTTEARNAISNPATGLTVYDTELNSFYFYNGTSWIYLLNQKTGWNLLGNSGTIAGTNFIGTTDAVDFVAKTNNIERLRISSTGNLGIGTASPNAPLQFATDVANRKIVLFENSNNDHEFVGFGVNPYILRYQVSSVYANHVFYAASGESGSNELMRINGFGNVGIGNATPNAPLQFASSAANRKIVLYENANNDHEFLGFGINNSILRYQVSSTFANHVFYAANGASSSNELMRIQGNGNVGIGTATPLAKLDVAGSLRVGNDVWHTSTDGILRSYYETNGNTFFASGAGYNFLNSTYTNVLAILNNGNIGIGTASPSAKLEVAGSLRLAPNVWHTSSDGSSRTYYQSNGHTYFGTGTGAGYIFNNSSGNPMLVIGGNNNTKIYGQIEIAGGSPGVGKVLTSDANGLASWSTLNGLSGGTTNYLPKWSSSTTLSTNSLIYDDGNAIGIGTNSFSDLSGSRFVVKTNSSQSMTYNNSGNLILNNIGSQNVSIRLGEIYSGRQGISSSGKLELQSAATGIVFGNNNVEYMRMDNTGRLGIGTSSPTKLLELNGSSAGLKIHNSGSNGAFSSVELSTNGGSTFLIKNLGATTTIQHGNSENITLSSDGNVGINLQGNPLAKLTIGNGTAVSVLNDYTDYQISLNQSNTPCSSAGFGVNGSLMIYNSASEHKFDVNCVERVLITYNETILSNGLLLYNDLASKPGTSTWFVTSDERLKNINGSYTKGLAEILKLNTITYQYKDVENKKFDPKVLEATQVGFSAQEVQKIFPEAVSVDKDGYLSLNIHAILVAYTNAIKELDTKNKELEKTNADSKESVEKLEAKNLEQEKINNDIKEQLLKENALLKSQIESLNDLKAEVENLKTLMINASKSEVANKLK